MLVLSAQFAIVDIQIVRRGHSRDAVDYAWRNRKQMIHGRIGVLLVAADAGEIDTVWVADHLLQADPTAVPDSEMLEAHTALGALAAHTERVRLGTMVSAVTFRAPSLLIKAVTTRFNRVDVGPPGSRC